MELSIEVTREDLMQAAENLVYTQSLNEDIEANEEAIASVIKNHLEKAIEEILTNPKKHLTLDEWKQVNDCCLMSYSAYIKMMNRDIPYPI
jgi:hypothetical protein